MHTASSFQSILAQPRLYRMTHCINTPSYILLLGLPSSVSGDLCSFYLSRSVAESVVSSRLPRLGMPRCRGGSWWVLRGAWGSGSRPCSAWSKVSATIPSRSSPLLPLAPGAYSRQLITKKLHIGPEKNCIQQDGSVYILVALSREAEQRVCHDTQPIQPLCCHRPPQPTADSYRRRSSNRKPSSFLAEPSLQGLVIYQQWLHNRYSSI